jgi:hypothetical protein
MTTTLLTEKEGFRIGELFHLDWDTPGGLTKVQTGQPTTSIQGNNQAQPGMMTVPFRFRVSGTGNKVVLLADDPAFFAGKTMGTRFIIYDAVTRRCTDVVVLLEADLSAEYEVTDFLVTDDNTLFLLEKLVSAGKPVTNRLRCVDTTGHVNWEIQEQLPAGKYTGIIKEQAGFIYIQYEEPGKTAVLKVNTKTGAVDKWAVVDKTGIPLFISEQMRIGYVSFIKEKNNRAFVQYDPVTGKEEIQYANPGIYEMLTFPVATDRRMNLYGANGLSLSCLTPALQQEWTFPVNNVVPAEDGLLFISQYNENTQDLLIYRSATGGKINGVTKIHLSRPGIRMGRLNRLTDRQDFVIETFEGKDRRFWTYNNDKKELAELPAEESGQRFVLQSARTSRVDNAGYIYMAVAGPQAFHIIKIAQ